MLEERKTHYSDTRYCDKIGEEVIVEQMKGSEMIIVKCEYMNLDRCDVNLNNPGSCPLNSKLVRIIKG